MHDTSSVDLLDLAIVGLLGLSAYGGYRRGAVMQVLTLGGLLVGLLVGALVAPRLAELASVPFAQTGIALGVLLICAGIGDVVGWMIGHRVRTAARKRTRLRPADAIGGSVLSVVVLLLAVWFVALNLVNGPFLGLSGEIEGSAIVRRLEAALPQPPSLLTETRRFLGRFGLPEVFIGLPPPPTGPVQNPTTAQARRAFAAADQSTVRIVGPACGLVSEGSGFVVAPNYVLTNAHVVAGMVRTEVQQQNGPSRTATVVLFDPRLDLALLWTPNTPGPPLQFAPDVGRGAKGAVLGYPEGGDLKVGRAAVRQVIQPKARDIYYKDTVVRKLLELQTTVRPGNSGGPFVLVTGKVGGIVFAASTTQDGIGYAIAADGFLPEVRAAVGRRRPVSTRSCTH